MANPVARFLPMRWRWQYRLARTRFHEWRRGQGTWGPIGARPPRALGPRIFLIGFNKTATTSLSKWFRDSGILTIHFGGHLRRNNLAVRMVSNHSAGLPMLDGIDGYEAYSDLNYAGGGIYIEAVRLFRQLHVEHPDAYFILNTRRTEDWIRSRHAHVSGDFVRNAADALGVTEARLKEIEAALHARHEAEVTEYFAEHAARFLRYDIDADGPEVVAAFLADSYTLDPAGLPAKYDARPEETGT